MLVEKMETVDIIEGILFKIPSIKIALSSLGFFYNGRTISATNRPEFNNILSNFNSPKIISVVSITQLTMIIEPIFLDRKIPVIIINGDSCEIKTMSKTLIQSTLYSHLNIKDFLPKPFVKKIIYISDYGLKSTNNNKCDINNLIDYKEEVLSGVVFSEYTSGVWTIDDPLSLPVNNTQKIWPNAILFELMNDLLKE